MVDAAEASLGDSPPVAMIDPHERPTRSGLSTSVSRDASAGAREGAPVSGTDPRVAEMYAAWGAAWPLAERVRVEVANIVTGVGEYADTTDAASPAAHPAADTLAARGTEASQATGDCAAAAAAVREGADVTVGTPIWSVCPEAALFAVGRVNSAVV